MGIPHEASEPMPESVYRVQDDEGRGPYRPGASHRWADDKHQAPTWMEEFGLDLKDRFAPEESGGCGFRSTEQARAWFSRTERRRLVRLGYSLVRMQVDRILAESPIQLVFARRQPFHIGALIVPWN